MLSFCQLQYSASAFQNFYYKNKWHNIHLKLHYFQILMHLYLNQNMLHACLDYAIHVYETHIILLIFSFFFFFFGGEKLWIPVIVAADIPYFALCFIAGVYPGFHPSLGLQYYTCGKLEWLEYLLRFVSFHFHSGWILSLLIFQTALADSLLHTFS